MNTYNITFTRLMTMTLMLGGLLFGIGNSPSYGEDKGTLDFKSYSAASLCFAPIKDESFTNPRMELGPDGSIENTAMNKTEELQIVCPIPRDNTDTSSGLSVYVNYDIHDYAITPFTCHLSSRDLAGTRLYGQKKKSVEESGTGILFLNLPGSQLRGSDGIALLNCTIPAKRSGLAQEGSRLTSILVGENR